MRLRKRREQRGRVGRDFCLGVDHELEILHDGRVAAIEHDGELVRARGDAHVAVEHDGCIDACRDKGHGEIGAACTAVHAEAVMDAALARELSLCARAAQIHRVHLFQMPCQAPEALFEGVDVVLDGDAVLSDDLLRGGAREDGIPLVVPQLFGPAAGRQGVERDDELPRLVRGQQVGLFGRHLDGVLTAGKDAGVDVDFSVVILVDGRVQDFLPVQVAGHGDAGDAGLTGNADVGAQSERLDLLAHCGAGAANQHPSDVDVILLAGHIGAGRAVVVDSLRPVGHRAPLAADGIGGAQSAGGGDNVPVRRIVHAALIHIALHRAVGVGGRRDGDRRILAAHNVGRVDGPRGRRRLVVHDGVRLAGRIRALCAHIVHRLGAVSHGRPAVVDAVGHAEAAGARKLRPAAAVHLPLVDVIGDGAVLIGRRAEGHGGVLVADHVAGRNARRGAGGLVDRECAVVRDPEIRVQDQSGRDRIRIVAVPVVCIAVRLHRTDVGAGAAAEVRRPGPGTGGGPVEIDHFRSPARIIGKGNAVVW